MLATFLPSFRGDVQVGPQAVPNMIALPCDISNQAVSLTLFLDPDYRKVFISGQALKATLEGDAEYIEEFHPKRGQSSELP